MLRAEQTQGLDKLDLFRQEIETKIDKSEDRIEKKLEKTESGIEDKISPKLDSQIFWRFFTILVPIVALVIGAIWVYLIYSHDQKIDNLQERISTIEGKLSK